METKLEAIENFYKNILKDDLLSDQKLLNIKDGIRLLKNLENHCQTKKLVNLYIDTIYSIVNKDFTNIDPFCERSYKINTYSMFWAYLLVLQYVYNDIDDFKNLDKNSDFTIYYTNHYALGIINSLLVIGLNENSCLQLYKDIYNFKTNLAYKLNSQNVDNILNFLYYVINDIFQHSFHAITELGASFFYLNDYGLYKLYYHLLHWYSLFVLGMFKYDKSEESLKLGLKLFEKAHDYEFIGHKKNPFCYHNIK